MLHDWPPERDTYHGGEGSVLPFEWGMDGENEVLSPESLMGHSVTRQTSLRRPREWQFQPRFTSEVDDVRRPRLSVRL